MIFDNFDLANFWDNSSEWARESYVGEKVTDELIRSTESELGYRLPASYLELMRSQNGGMTHRDCFPTEQRTTWSHNHVAISGILGIGRDKTYSLCGSIGSSFMIEEWGYPEIGVCICNCPSAGHDMIMLDYSKCGPTGEPEVVHVDQEWDYKITFLAKNFEEFIRGLVPSSVYDTSEQDLIDALKKIDHGSFSSTLTKLIADSGEPMFGPLIRKLCRDKTNDFGAFALHADETSQTVYDLLFYLYSATNVVRDKESYFKIYPDIIVFGDGDFSTKGYAPSFIEGWFDERVASKKIVDVTGVGLKFSDEYMMLVRQKLVQ